MHILIAEPRDEALKPMLSVTAEHVSRIRMQFPDAAVTVARDRESLAECLPDADVLVALDLDGIAWNNAKKLRWVHALSAGVSIPDALRTSNVLLTNSSGVHAIPIAEHVLGCMLMFSRCFGAAHRIQIEQKEWQRSNTLFDVSELHGKTVAIIGYGRVGRGIAALAKAFGMAVRAVARTPRDDVHGMDQLAVVLGKADYVVNCLPLTDETRNLFSYPQFSMMKRSAYFINIGRGGTVREEELIRALKEKTIAGAALDVFQEEPLPLTSELWHLDNVIITPHIAGWTPHYLDRAIDIFLTNLDAFLEGKTMPNLVDKEKGY